VDGGRKEGRTTFVVICIPADAGAAEEVGEEVEVGLRCRTKCVRNKSQEYEEGSRRGV
jgi:hypothetical protein